MDLKDYKYTARFEAVAKVIAPSDENRFEAKASLENLKGILPAGINPDENPDMLYIAFNGALAGMANRNDDSISCETALKINSTALYKYISTEHDREKIVGVILHPSFSRFGTDEPLTDAEAATLKEPFNMSYVGALWKVISPMLTKYIDNTSGTTDENSLSTSWEIAFSNYNIGCGGTNVFDTKIVTPEDPSFASYDKMLRVNGGSGKDAAGNRLFRIVSGDAIILGYSVVVNPAASVRGILSLEKPVPATQEEIDSLASAVATFSQEGLSTTQILQRLSSIDCANKVSTKDLAEALARVKEPSVEIKVSEASSEVKIENNQNSSITSNQSRINHSTTNSMKIESKEQLKSSWAEICKLETSAAVEDFVSAIEEGSKKFVNELEAEQNKSKQLEEARAAFEKQSKENEARASALEASMNEMKAELEKVRQAAASAEAQSKFTDRMASFDEKFELDDEDRRLIADDVRAIASSDDNAFEAYAKKQDKLLAGKKKGAKAPPFTKKDDKNSDKEDDKNKPDSDEPDEDDMKAAIASVKEDPTQTKIPNNSEPVIDQSLEARMKAAFGPAFKVNGKAVADKK